MNHQLRTARTPVVVSTAVSDHPSSPPTIAFDIDMDGHAPHLPRLPIGLSPDGEMAMVPVTDEAGSTLWAVTRSARSSKWRVEGPGWVVGSSHDAGFVACAQRLGDAPSFAVIVDGHVRYQDNQVIHPVCVPAVWERWLLVLLVLQPDPWTRTGPSMLCTLDLHSDGPLPMPVAAVDGDRIGVVVDGDQAVVTVASRRRDHVVRLRL